MGYTTDFVGSFEVSPVLKEEHRQYLEYFSNTRRMKRDSNIAEKFDDPVREQVGLPIGEEAEYFVGSEGFMGQSHDKSVIDYNQPPKTQPGLWCQWIPSEDGNFIEWDGGEKFYDYIEWIQYLIDNFLKPWGYKLNGNISWYGEDPEDIGLIEIANNNVNVRQGRIVYE